jgi:glycosyltransferase involved in cell wall biosynthesis
MGLLSIFRRSGPSTAGSDFFDVFHGKTVEAITDSRGLPLSEWSPADADSSVSAVRFVLACLRENPKLRALPPGREVQQKLLHAGRDRGLSQTVLAGVEAAFAAQPGEAVRDYYMHTAWLQSRYPLALLPVGQKRFAKWLFGKGREQHQFTDEQILWFLHDTATDLPRGIAETYLLSPDWQTRFPGGYAGPNEFRLLQWLRREFPKFDALRQVRSLPRLPAIVQLERSSRAGVNILSHFCYPSGIQQAVLAYKSSLESVGFETSARDVPAGVQTALLPRRDWLGLETFAATVITVAPFPHFENCYALAGLARREGVYRIAYWAWELDTIPEEWVKLAESVDEIWTPTQFVADAMRTRMTLPVTRMLPGVLMGEIEEVPRARFGIAAEHCVFLFMFDMLSEFERKNPLAVVHAFRAAFAPDEQATLVIKVSRGTADAANLERLRAASVGHNIVVIDESVSRAKAFGYLQMCDCFVSLHRSEGFGLGMAEAMLLGKPVIATNYSGNLDFMHADSSLLVDYEMTEITADGPIYKKGNRWAEPSVEHAAALMRRVFEDREGATQLGARARAELTEKLALRSAGMRMAERLKSVGLPVP